MRMTIRVLAALTGGCLIALPGVMMGMIIYLSTFPERTFLIGVIYFMLWYGGVALGIFLRWLRAKKKRQPMTAFDAFKAGFWVVFSLVAAYMVALGVYGWIVKPLPFWIGNVTPALAIFLVIIGLIPVTGAALLLYGIRGAAPPTSSDVVSRGRGGPADV